MTTMTGATMMASTIAHDLEHVDFDAVPGIADYLEPARRLAVTLDLRALAPAREAATAAAAASIAGLGLAELIAELDFEGEALPLLFAIAETFGHAHPAAGWRGLAPIPVALLGLTSSAGVAVPVGAGRWVLWLAHDDDNAGPCPLYWIDSVQLRLRGPVPRGGAALPGTWQHGLLGMPTATLAVLPDSTTLRDSAATPLAPGAWQAYGAAQRALLSGLLCGACRRLREEAFAYAQSRRSGGKPIIQLQAVALRLANIALAEQNLALYAAALAGPVHQRDPVSAIASLDVAYVTESALAIARDAVQVAAAHGYVEGLPFKRLFEQVHTLASVLSSHAQTADGEFHGT